MNFNNNQSFDIYIYIWVKLRRTCVAWNTEARVAAFSPHASPVVATRATVAQVHFNVTLVMVVHASETLQKIN